METDGFRQPTADITQVSWTEQTLVTKYIKPSTYTHLFSMEVAIYVQELLIFWGISHVTYFFLREALLFVSCYSCHNHWVAFPQRKGPWKDEKKALWAQSQPVLPNVLVLWKQRVPSCLFEHMQRSTAVQLLKPLVGRDEFFYLLSNLERLFNICLCFFICAVNLMFYWSVCTDSPKLHFIFIIICICFLNK